MKEIFRKVCEEAEKRKVSLRTAAYLLAINRILKAAKIRGEIRE